MFTAVGTSGDGDWLIAYENGLIGVYNTSTQKLLHTFANPTSVQAPSAAFVDPHKNYLLIRGFIKDGFPTWVCFRISTGEYMWNSCNMYTLDRPVWYSKGPDFQTSSMCLQNNDFYGIDLSSGIDLETGFGTDLLPHKSSTHSQRSTRSNASKPGGTWIYNCDTYIYDHGEYRHLKCTFDPETHTAHFHLDGVGTATLQLSEDTTLIDEFTPIQLVAQRQSTPDLVIIMRNGQVHFVTLQDEKP